MIQFAIHLNHLATLFSTALAVERSFLALVVAPGIARTIKITIKRKGKIIMLVVHVKVQVKPECIDAFKAATLENARQSACEPGIARFDVVQQADDATRFVLVEAYRSVEASAAHKETKHYQIWREAVAPMMAAPRSSVKFANVFPEDIF